MRIQIYKKAEAGIALIIVMISMFVLTILAGGFAYSMKVETQLAMHANDETELQWIGRSGMEYCRWVLALQMACPSEPYDSLDQIWAGGQGGNCATNGAMAEIQREVKCGRGKFTWMIRDNERKWNINTVNEPVLQQALLLLGVDAGEVTPLVNAILDWVDPDDGRRVEGTESEYYQKFDPPYSAKNGPIDSISELLLIKGITGELYWGPASTNNPPGVFQRQLNPHAPINQPTLLNSGLADLFTPISGGRININTAPMEALQVIPEVTETMAQQIVQIRSELSDPMSGMGGPFVNTQVQYLMSRIPSLTFPAARNIATYGDVRSYTFEVEIKAEVGNSSRTYRGIIRRNGPRDLPLISFFWDM